MLDAGAIAQLDSTAAAMLEDVRALFAEKRHSLPSPLSRLTPWLIAVDTVEVIMEAMVARSVRRGVYGRLPLSAPY